MSSSDFSAVLLEAGNLRLLSDGDRVTNAMTDEGPEPIELFLFGRCGTCEAANVLSGDSPRNAALDTQETGTDDQHTSDLYATCAECGSEMQALIRYEEYSDGEVRVLGADFRKNVANAPIGGLEHFVERVSVEV